MTKKQNSDADQNNIYKKIEICRYKDEINGDIIKSRRMPFNTKLINIATKTVVTNTCVNIKWFITWCYDERRN